MQWLRACTLAQTRRHWSDDVIVATIANVARHLDMSSAGLVGFLLRGRANHHDAPAIDELHRERDFQVNLVTFAAGEELALHDHPLNARDMYLYFGTVDRRRV